MNTRKWIVGALLLGLLNVAALTSAQEANAWVLDLLPAANDPQASQKLLAAVDDELLIEGLLLEEPFTQLQSWENYTGETGFARVQDEGYRITQSESGEPMWGQNETVHSNVLIELQTEQLSAEINNGYGIMCRANPENNGEGYYGLISGDGFHRILVVDEAGFRELTEWRSTPIIAQGQARNHIAMLCYEDRIALFANSELLIEVRDDTFTQGVAGLAAFTYEEDASIDVRYDNLRIWSVTATDGADASTLPLPTAAPADADAFSTIITDNDDPDALPEGLAADVRFGAVPIEVGSPLLVEDFSEDDSWETFVSDDGEVSLQPQDGVFIATTGRGEGFTYWGLSFKAYENVVIQVESSDNSENPNNGYGLTCRSASMTNSDGYYLLISADGFAAISRAIDGEFERLYGWEASEDVVQSGDNIITAVCVENYFAVYANGVLVAEVIDEASPYAEGFVGMTLAGYEDPGIVAEVIFDNFRVWQASRADQTNDD